MLAFYGPMVNFMSGDFMILCGPRVVANQTVGYAQIVADWPTICGPLKRLKLRPFNDYEPSNLRLAFGALIIIM